MSASASAASKHDWVYGNGPLRPRVAHAGKKHKKDDHKLCSSVVVKFQCGHSWTFDRRCKEDCPVVQGTLIDDNEPIRAFCHRSKCCLHDKKIKAIEVEECAKDYEVDKERLETLRRKHDRSKAIHSETVAKYEQESRRISLDPIVLDMLRNERTLALRQQGSDEAGEYEYQQHFSHSEMALKRAKDKREACPALHANCEARGKATWTLWDKDESYWNWAFWYN